MVAVHEMLPGLHWKWLNFEIGILCGFRFVHSGSQCLADLNLTNNDDAPPYLCSSPIKVSILSFWCERNFCIRDWIVFSLSLSWWWWWWWCICCFFFYIKIQLLLLLCCSSNHSRRMNESLEEPSWEFSLDLQELCQLTDLVWVVGGCRSCSSNMQTIHQQIMFQLEKDLSHFGWSTSAMTLPLDSSLVIWQMYAIFLPYSCPPKKAHKTLLKTLFAKSQKCIILPI